MMRPPDGSGMPGLNEPHRTVEYVGQLALEMADLCAQAGEGGLSDEMRLIAKKLETRTIELRIAARQS